MTSILLPNSIAGRRGAKDPFYNTFPEATPNNTSTPSVENNGYLTFRCEIPVGKGHSEVEIYISHEDFPLLIKTMMDVDRQAAMNAMFKELRRRVK